MSMNLPPIIVERTGCPTVPGGPMEPEDMGARVPWAMCGEMFRIDINAEVLYRIISEHSMDGPQYLNMNYRAPWLFRTAEDVLASADALERQGWLLRDRQGDGTERWTPLGRDQPRAEPRTALTVRPRAAR